MAEKKAFSPKGNSQEDWNAVPLQKPVDGAGEASTIAAR